MKRRRDVPPEELPKVIALKQGNASWLKIQKETGIPRRIAKRAYEQWQRTQAWEQLKEARTAIAGEEFRKHLDALNRSADALIGVLGVPLAPVERMKSEEVLARLWGKDLLNPKAVELSEFSYPDQPTAADVRRIERQNKMLFQSLQVHTQGKVRWEALDEWKQSWDRCITLLSQLNKHATEVMAGNALRILGSIVELEKATDQKSTVERMAEFVLSRIWLKVPDSQRQQKSTLFVAMETPGGAFVVAVPENPVLLLTFKQMRLAEDAAKICNMTADNLATAWPEIFKEIGNERALMMERIGELEGALDPLRLRPLILSSRCELCPA